LKHSGRSWGGNKMITDKALQRHLLTHHTVEDMGQNMSSLAVEYGNHYWIMIIGKKDYDKHGNWRGKYMKIRDCEKQELIREGLSYLFETIKYDWLLKGKLK
jgi:hypothetical protein